MESLNPSISPRDVRWNVGVGLSIDLYTSHCSLGRPYADSRSCGCRWRLRSSLQGISGGDGAVRSTSERTTDCYQHESRTTRACRAEDRLPGRGWRSIRTSPPRGRSRARGWVFTGTPAASGHLAKGCGLTASCCRVNGSMVCVNLTTAALCHRTTGRTGFVYTLSSSPPQSHSVRAGSGIVGRVDLCRAFLQVSQLHARMCRVSCHLVRG